MRLVVPWKYGFKGIKAIVKISFTDSDAAHNLEQNGARRIRILFQRESAERPSALEPGQERRIGEFRKRPTLMFNGYG